MHVDPPLGLALFEPDQPGNFGAALRLSACLGLHLEVIEPCGFPLDDRRIRRAAMDYASDVDYRRHADLGRFIASMRQAERRLVLLSSRATAAYHRFAFRRGDVLVAGSESRGASPALTASVDAAVRIPLRPGLRSLNVAMAAAIAVAEALRQLEAFPGGLEQAGCRPGEGG